ncbi:hypothetical protein J2Y41_000281 [Arthrobacter sp. 1088]|uniref:hypothetical protein n=1 Tax=Arthrobacter sp. 1088 TaxID=2817768 RepID=UPI00285BF399|nr:hypothetical protein [Arthrobacter sp. 1088]MDR6684734.1 hypothetical protein [Arthrobacter sp. 1088]
MKAIRAIPRATQILRSVMIAGAGTAVWMALSATAANADSGITDNHSLVGGVTSSVSSTVSSADIVSKQTNKTLDAAAGAVKKAAASAATSVGPKPSAPAVTIPVPNVPAPAPAKAVVPAHPITVHVPAVTPVVNRVADSTDKVIATVPVVNRVVPKGAVGNVVDTAVKPATGTIDDAVAAVVPPVNNVLEPVGLDPVTDVTNPVAAPIVEVIDTILPAVGNVLPPISGPGSLLPPLLGGDGAMLPATPGAGAVPPPAVGTSSATPSDEGLATESTGLPLGTPPTLSADVSVAFVLARGFAPASSSAIAGASVMVEPEAPAELPADPDVAPLGVIGAGSGTSQNGPPSPAAAFLHGALIVPADTLSGQATASNEHHPKPVSFDPGSSPD